MLNTRTTRYYRLQLRSFVTWRSRPILYYKIMKALVKAVACLAAASICVVVVTRFALREDSMGSSMKLSLMQRNAAPIFDKSMLKFANESKHVEKALQDKYGPIQFSGVRHVDTTLTDKEMELYQECVKTGVRERTHNGSKFWGKAEHIRRTHHKYLTKEDAILMEVGGNQGNDASEFAKLYNPRYIILEPLEEYSNILKNLFRNNSRVTVVNLGLGRQDEVVFVKMDGNNACATSKFSGVGGQIPLYIVNTTAFMLKLGVGLFDIDLLTMNCEGCEFEALETLLSTNLISHFKNIQWATHSTIKGLDAPIERYCKITQLLWRTHRPTYKYTLIWESWRRRDVP